MSESNRMTAERSTERDQESIGDLLGAVSRDFSTLLRQEAELAKAELRQEVSSAGKVGAMFGGAAVAGLLTLLFLSCALWWGLSNVMDQGWAALIVAVIWGLIGAVLFVQGRKRMRSIRTLPRTTQTARQIPDAVRGR